MAPDGFARGRCFVGSSHSFMAVCLLSTFSLPAIDSCLRLPQCLSSVTLPMPPSLSNHTLKVREVFIMDHEQPAVLLKSSRLENSQANKSLPSCLPFPHPLHFFLKHARCTKSHHDQAITPVLKSSRLKNKQQAALLLTAHDTHRLHLRLHTHISS